MKKKKKNRSKIFVYVLYDDSTHMFMLTDAAFRREQTLFQSWPLISSSIAAAREVRSILKEGGG